MTPRIFNANIKRICDKNGWEVWDTYSDRKKDGTVRRSYARNGWRVPNKMKKNIINDINNFIKAEGIEARVSWHVSMKYGYGEYDKLVILTAPGPLGPK